MQAASAQGIDSPSVPFATVSSMNYLFLALRLLRRSALKPELQDTRVCRTFTAAETPFLFRFSLALCDTRTPMGLLLSKGRLFALKLDALKLTAGPVTYQIAAVVALVSAAQPINTGSKHICCSMK